MILAACVLLSSMAFAQTAVDDFESYTVGGDVSSVWEQTGGWSATSIITPGADSSGQGMQITDGGWSNGVEADDFTTPPATVSPPAADSYKLTLYYKNGQQDDAFPNLTVHIKQNGSTLRKLPLGGDVKTNWTYAESIPVEMTTDPITILVDNDGSLGSTVGACAIDELELVQEDMPILVTTRPTDVVYLSGTENISTFVEGGTGTFDKVEYDIENDGSIDSTDSDSSDGFNFSWDTTSVISSTSGTVDLNIIAYDDSAATGELLQSFFIDNRRAGREQLIANGDFSAWTGDIPNNWNLLMDGASPEYGKGPGRDMASTPSLQITFSASDYTNRYVMRSQSWEGWYQDIQTTWWGKGGSCRMYYFTSSDGGTTWDNTLVDAGSIGAAEWKYIESDVIHDGLAGGGELEAIATHMFSAETCNWDDVSVKGIDMRESGVKDWNIYMVE